MLTFPGRLNAQDLTFGQVLISPFHRWELGKAKTSPRLENLLQFRYVVDDRGSLQRDKGMGAVGRRD